MKKLKSILVNMMALCATTLFIRIITVSFSIYITNKIGAAGIGLYSLITNVGGFAITFALSGINLAAMRLTAEAIGKGSEKSVRDAMKRCIIYSLVFGISASLLLLGLSKFISVKLIDDIRTLIPIRLLSISLPFIALSSAMQGYFTGVRKIVRGSCVQILEQLMKVFGSIYLIGIMGSHDAAGACIALVCGSCVGEILSFTVNSILYLTDRKRFNKKKGISENGLTKKLLGITLPIAFSTYVRSGLLTVEHILIPRGLRKFGNSGEGALAQYGVLVGMALPVVLFPHAFLAAFSGLLIPELTECQAKGDKSRIDHIASRVLNLTMIFSVGAAGIMLCFAQELGKTIYHNSNASQFIAIMAPLVIVMYLDNVVDSMLKGLGEQLYSMKVNIVDAFLSVILVYIIIPRAGIYGYVAVIFISELVNATFSIMRLLSIVTIKPDIVKWVFMPLFCVVGSTSVVKIILSQEWFIRIFGEINAFSGVLLSVIAYTVFLRVTGTFDSTDVKWVKGTIMK